jgi:hypothetical protein
MRKVQTDDVMLALFKEQLDNEAVQLAQDYRLTRRGDHLIWWYFLRLRDLDPNDVRAIVCDGGSDLGIDAVHIDDNNVVHFYAFTNPTKRYSAYPAGDVDKTIAGLTLILARRHEGVANPQLKAKVQEIFKAVRQGYRLHLVTSSRASLPKEAKDKLDAFVANLGSSATALFTYELEDLRFLQDAFYSKNLPVVESPIRFQLESKPYMVRSGDHECFIFHLPGATLATLFDEHGDDLLQRNIRVYQGDSATNESIRDACTADQSADFLHYNNGVTFLSETAYWDDFAKCLMLNKAQIVNGGQTVRVLHDAYTNHCLKPDVLVPVRVVTSKGDKDFASNVAVNQNSQNRMKSSFLRSNHPLVIQLSASMASLGWYLERRDGESRSLTPEERDRIHGVIGRPLAGAVVNLTQGTQAYVATYMRQPELAKKNPGKMFIGTKDGGHFEEIFSDELSADKFAIAQQIKWVVDDLIREFLACKRRKSRMADADWRADYKGVLNSTLVAKYADQLDQAVPQSAIFLCAILFEEHTRIRGLTPADLLTHLKTDPKRLLCRSLETIIAFARRHKNSPDIANKSWPTLLKSQTFFEGIARSLPRGAALRKG